MRTLCLADRAEWPARSGGSLRLQTTLAALTELGDVDFFATVPADGTSSGPPELDGVNARIIERPLAGSSAHVLARWLTERSPRHLLVARAGEARAALAGWAQPPYDLVWYSPGSTFSLLGGVVDGPTIVDLDNLFDHATRREREVRTRDRRAGGPDRSDSRPRHRAALSSAFDRLDERRWGRWQRDVAASVDNVVVCSEVDRRRLDVANAAVIPNCYEAPREWLGRGTAEAPRFTMVGRHTYRPNLDGARFFAQQVLPRIRVALPSAEFRVVGKYDHRLRALGSSAGVTLCGEVVDTTPELAASSVVVAPIRLGSGTRIKVIEAFAHRIPVVTTTVGCEGLDVGDGVHALVADDPAAFAAACIRLVHDDELRARLTASAFQLYEERYQASDVRCAVKALAGEVASRARQTTASR